MSNPLSCGLVLHGLVAVIGVSVGLRAQCGLQWQPGQLPGADAPVVESVQWDADGAGPGLPVVVFGGAFRAIGPLAARGVAVFDPWTQQWSTLGTGIDGEVHDLAVLPNGDLVVGGIFASAGGVPAACVAAWNGTAWRALGSGVTGPAAARVDALAVAPDGSLVAGGMFAVAGGAPAANLARWDGIAWSSIGGGVGGEVAALAHLLDGSLVVGGWFAQAGNVAVSQIARWDGSAWSSLGGGVALAGASPSVSSLLVLPNGDLVVGGVFSHAGATLVGSVALWDGAAWHSMANGILAPVLDLEPDPSGAVLATSWITGGHCVMRWDGTTWTSLGPVANATLRCVTALGNGELFVGGDFRSIGTTTVFGLTRWNGSSWSTMVSATVPFAQPPTHLLPLPSGDLVVMRATSPVGAVEISQWNGAAWQSLGAGLPTLFVRPQLADLGNGDLLLSGSLLASRFLRWSGGVWASIPGAPTIYPDVMIPDGAGGVYLGAANQVLRWNGTTTTGLGTCSGGVVRQLAVLPNGDLVAAGTFTSVNAVPAASIARYDGSQWHALGTGISGPATDLAVLPDGDVVASGAFTTAGGVAVANVARWNGSVWSPFGTGMTPTRLASLQNGEVLAIGEAIVNGVPLVNQLARGDGSGWTVLGGFNGPPTTVAVGADGVAHVAGTFTNAGGQGAAFLASLASNCPAGAVPYGTGCAGSAGIVALAATSLPWIGGRSVNVATNLAANAAVLGLVGFSATATPLSAIHPAAPAGCLLLTSPIAVVWLGAASGIAAWDLAIPNDPSFVGLTLREQIVQGEFGGGFLSLLSSSNGLALTIGAQ